MQKEHEHIEEEKINDHDPELNHRKAFHNAGFAA
jgi:hypothetical protein